jgi:hypothetical protein
MMQRFDTTKSQQMLLYLHFFVIIFLPKRNAGREFRRSTLKAGRLRTVPIPFKPKLLADV